jgi:gas vesicle protein
MKTTEETPSTTEPEVELGASGHGRAGFLVGIVFGAFLGAGLALLFAPERGGQTRRRLRNKMRSLQSEAMDSLDRAGNRTSKELNRRKRRLKLELERLRERARERAREVKDASGD